MDIHRLDTPQTKWFEDLNTGDVFMSNAAGRENFVFMKIDEVFDNTDRVESVCNAVYLNDGDLAFFSNDDEVIPMAAELNIRIKTMV